MESAARIWREPIRITLTCHDVAMLAEPPRWTHHMLTFQDAPDGQARCRACGQTFTVEAFVAHLTCPGYGA